MAAGVPCDPVRDMPGLAAAGPEAGYAVQQLNTEHWLRAGLRVSGHKVGLTNPAVQEQLGMDEPIWGVLFADRCRTDGDDLGGAGLIEPRVEVEVAVVLGADLDKGQHTVADVIRATAFVLPAFEIVDSRIAGWDITNFDMIADNAGAGLYVLGTRPVPLAAVDLRRVEMQLTVNGEDAATGSGAACLGNPLNSVLWLADTMSQRGTPLQAGECIMTGSLCPMRPITPGDKLHAEIDGLGTVSAELSSL
ncbi:MAG: 2-keto-4-pentenoate hydratase [Acidimicrobiaceae bacterium]|nr:2-keto-4-pentenoate hydratase [Acidimicrobiaceae bacterium]MYB86599.1 2-keto-4-pentenoate hydratase [Acidimicrobiaceae bacterium]MYH92567.1 2-keto-4-pentenoate hydratase [Acidimicrobiaceae bacterium]